LTGAIDYNSIFRDFNLLGAGYNFPFPDQQGSAFQPGFVVRIDGRMGKGVQPFALIAGRCLRKRLLGRQQPGKKEKKECRT
jgi:hypothetical protein